jgi:Uma2 family endonuclease
MAGAQNDQEPSHVLASELVRNEISRRLPNGWCMHSQEPVRLSTSVPESDVMVVRGDLRDYRDRWPRAEKVGLIIEVSDASLARDRVFKKSLCAQAGIPCYWVVNLVDRRIEEYTEPAGAGDTADYRVHRDYSTDVEIPVVLDGRQLAAIPARDVLH